MRRLTTRPQRTLRTSCDVRGVGFITGSASRVRFLPAPPSTGVVFVRTDLAGRPRVPAHVTMVTGTARRTTLGKAPAQVTLVEHVLAALAGLRIDNCLVEIDAPEPPGLDGSSGGFVAALSSAGVVCQEARRSVWAAEEPTTVRAGNATLTLYPPTTPGDSSLTMSYFLDYGPRSPIARQVHTGPITPVDFGTQLADCRTFLLLEEANELQRQGVGVNTKHSDLLVFGPRGVLDNTLRFANEPARHKVLDMVGDLSLLGADIAGHVVAYRSGHPLNVELAKALHLSLCAGLGRMAA